jgi:hypothetical protein
MKMMRLLLVVFFFFALLKNSSAQTDSVKTNVSIARADTIIKPDSAAVHSPKLATIFSAVVPGLGQAYNRKYWKIPIVYAGLGISAYFFVSNNKEYQRTRKALSARLDENPSTVDNDFTDPRYTDELLADRKDYFRRNRDLSAIIGVLIYVANIIDADVDAHLMYFNVDDNLSMNIAPASQGIACLSFSYKF